MAYIDITKIGNIFPKNKDNHTINNIDPGQLLDRCSDRWWYRQKCQEDITHMLSNTWIRMHCK